MKNGVFVPSFRKIKIIKKKVSFNFKSVIKFNLKKWVVN